MPEMVRFELTVSYFDETRWYWREVTMASAPQMDVCYVFGMARAKPCLIEYDIPPHRYRVGLQVKTDIEPWKYEEETLAMDRDVWKRSV